MGLHSRERSCWEQSSYGKDCGRCCHAEWTCLGQLQAARVGTPADGRWLTGPDYRAVRGRAACHCGQAVVLHRPEGPGRPEAPRDRTSGGGRRRAGATLCWVLPEPHCRQQHPGALPLTSALLQQLPPGTGPNDREVLPAPKCWGSGMGGGAV